MCSFGAFFLVERRGWGTCVAVDDVDDIICGICGMLGELTLQWLFLEGLVGMMVEEGERWRVVRVGGVGCSAGMIGMCGGDVICVDSPGIHAGRSAQV